MNDRSIEINQLKETLKKIILEILSENKQEFYDLFYDLITEVLEDILLSKGIKKEDTEELSVVQLIEKMRIHRTCFKTAEEVDQYIREERDSWDD